jgi:type I restriction enzyme S subunit
MARPLHARIVSNERESRTLAALRDALLPKLISGELRVKQAERFIEATT